MRHLPALGRMPGHGQNGWRKWVEFIGGAAWEAVRLADARGTVASGWAAGIAAGVGLGLGLEALAAVPVLIRLPRSIAKPPSSRWGWSPGLWRRSGGAAR